MIERGNAARALAASILSVAIAETAAAQTRSDALESEIRAIRERLAQIEASQRVPRRAVEAAAVEAGDRPRSWKLPGTNTSMSIGGFVYLHASVDLSGGGFVLGSAAPPDASLASATAEGTAAENRANGGSFQFNARHSRVIIQTSTPTDWGSLVTLIETDFRAGAGAFFRLRKAYGSLGPVLAGQDDSTFRMLFAEPNALDPGFAILTPESRRAQIRYSHNFGGGLVLKLAAEDPTDGVRVASCTPTSCAASTLPVGAAQRWPDFVGALDYFFPQGRVGLAGTIRELSADSGGVSALSVHDRTIGWGFDIGANVQLHRLVRIGGIGFVGEGIGSRIQGINFTDAVFTIAPGSNLAQLNAVLTYGGIGWVEVAVAPTVSVLGMGGWAVQEAEDEVAGPTRSARKIGLAGLADYAWFAGGNIIWSPVPQVSIGAEYIHGFAARYAGPNATLSRTSVSFRYRF